MASSIEPTRFRQGAGRPCLDFIRTLRHRGTPQATEELASPVDLAAWIRQCGPGEIASAIEQPDAAQLQQARTLREAIHELIQTVRTEGGTTASRPAVRNHVNNAAAHPVPVPRLQASGDIEWHADAPVTATLALIARDALDLVTSPAIARVRDCAGPRCGALFLDTSRPGTRRWCSMATCGNRAKKDALRTRGTVTEAG